MKTRYNMINLQAGFYRINYIYFISFQGLLIDGIEMEIYPANPVIPADSGPHLVIILCRPKSHGDLHIIGII